MVLHMCQAVDVLWLTASGFSRKSEQQPGDAVQEGHQHSWSRRTAGKCCLCIPQPLQAGHGVSDYAQKRAVAVCHPHDICIPHQHTAHGCAAHLHQWRKRFEEFVACLQHELCRSCNLVPVTSWQAHRCAQGSARPKRNAALQQLGGCM